MFYFLISAFYHFYSLNYGTILQKFQNSGTVLVVGVIVNTDNYFLKFKLYLLTFSGNIPAVSTVSGHQGHNSRHGCRICLAESFVGSDVKGRYYKPINAQSLIKYITYDEFKYGNTEFNLN